nr:MAG TPA: hypothetical protein [Caudoviricetes sp.]
MSSYRIIIVVPKPTPFCFNHDNSLIMVASTTRLHKIQSFARGFYYKNSNLLINGI